MAIPEHEKFVKMWKRIRYGRKYGHWRKVRQLRRIEGRLKPRERVRTLIKEEWKLHRANLMANTGYISYVKLQKDLLGSHYRRWGKYDD